MKKFRLAALVVLLFGCFALFGCSEKEPETVEITLLHGWGTIEDEHLRMQEIYRDFEKEHPNIKLNMRAMTSSEEVIENLHNMLSVGQVPDVVFTGGYGRDSVYRFMVENDKAVDLAPYLEKDPEFAASVAPEIRDFWSVGESLYTVSDVRLAAGGYWYNEEIFRQAGITQIPKTWDEFFDVCDRIERWAAKEKKDVVPVQLTQENSLFLADALLLDVSKGKTEWVKEHRMDQLDAESLDKAFEVIQRIYRYDRSAQKGYGYRDVGARFNEQKAAIYINGVWAGKLINEDIPARYAPLPGMEGRTSACLSAGLGYVLGKTGDQKKMDASVEFVKYLLSEPVQQRILRETGQMPSNPQIDLREFKQIDPRLCQAMETINSADRIIEVPSNFWSSEQIEAFQKYILDALQEKISTEEFLCLLKEDE